MGCYPDVQPSPYDVWGLQSALGTQQIPEVKKIKKNLKNVLLDSVAQAARGMLLLDLGGSITNSSRFWSVGHTQEQTSLKWHVHS